MKLSPFQLFIIFHLLVSALYALLIVTKRSSLTTANILPIVFIPLFGFFSALVADVVNFSKKTSTAENLQPTEVKEDIYWRAIRNPKQSENIIPLEEALIINDRFTRKKLIMDMLLDDPTKNIDILLLARENNDVDTAHYANTTIAKIQRDFQLHVQELAAAHQSSPQDMKILDEYIDILSRFIESGLPEAYLLRRQRILLDELLDEKIDQQGWSRDSLQLKIHNCLCLNDLNGAIVANEILKTDYPNDEQTWINALQISVARHDSAMLEDILEQIDNRDIDWSISGREIVNTWIEV